MKQTTMFYVDRMSDQTDSKHTGKKLTLYIKGTVLQTEKPLINDGLRVSRVS